MDTRLKEKLDSLPKSPGVYFLKNAKGSTMYIGKAGNLRNRVRSYFHPYSGFSGTRVNLSKDIKNIEWKETDSEIEALILESHLIKRKKPRYNVLLRDDKGYSFVEITKEDFPRIYATHQPHSDSSRVIGPFTDAGALKKTLRVLRGIFPYYTGPHPAKRTCTWCHIGLCPGPHPKKSEYKKSIRTIREILEGKRISGIIKTYSREMKSASKRQEYEKAAKLRDVIRALQNISLHKSTLENPISSVPSETLTVPEYISLLNTHLGISLSRAHRIRIEGYDISNIQGTSATGSMVVFESTKSPGEINDLIRPLKSEYRKFRIHGVQGANDVLMMEQVLRRRLSHAEWRFPDLIVIDGGPTQLAAARRATLTTPGLHIISLAKREEEIYLPFRSLPVRLPRDSHLLHLFMHVRDESHRFARGYYRTLHRKVYKRLNKSDKDDRV